MADKLEPKKSWTPMLAFFAIVVGAVALLWWVSRPTPPRNSAGGAAASVASPAPPSPSHAPLSPVRALCSVADVKRFIASQLASGEVPDHDLQQISTHVMNELVQAGLAENGCVSPADVTAVLYDLANDSDEY
jgi:hypothetical protein